MKMPVSENEKVIIAKRIGELKLKAAQRYDIAPQKCHVGHVVLQAMTDRPDDINQTDQAVEQSESNGSVVFRSCRLASAMRNYGIKVADAVVVMGPNHLDVAIPYYACHYNGYTLCTIDESMPVSDLQSVLSNANPKLVFCLESQAPNIEEAFKLSKVGPKIVYFDGQDNMETFINDNKGTETNFRPAEFEQSEVTAWLLLTSGTTGKPKLAIIPYDTLLNSVKCWWSDFTARHHIALAMGTIQWMSAMLFYISSPIMKFNRLQTSAPLTPQLLIGIINKYKPEATVWTVHLLSKFLNAAFHVCDLSCFKSILIGGAAVEKPMYDKFIQKCEAYLCLVYGMTELLVPVFKYKKDTPFGSSGTALEKFQYRLITEDGSNAETNENGELWIKGDEFFKGYLNNQEDTNEILTEDGWIKTGDIFRKDEDNYYYYVERKRLLIKYQGRWISPMQLEDIIKSHPGVADACVVGIPDKLHVEVPVAAVVRKKDTSAVHAQEIFDLVKRELPPLKHLHGGLFFVDSLPLTPSDKVNRGQLKEDALTATLLVSKN